MRTVLTLALVALLAGVAAACGNAPAKPARPDTSAPPAPAQVAGAPSAPGVPVSPATPPAPAPTIPAPAAAPQPPAAAAPPVIVDVRTQQEYDAGHVKGALLIPYDQLDRRWAELEQYRNQPIVLYCRTGRRAGIALDLLKQRGFTQVENAGGMDAMASRGFTITKD